VHNAQIADPVLNTPIRMEIGIYSCLHLIVGFEKSKFHLKDIMVGSFMFKVANIKI